ncbi:hypothetical protein HUT19_37610 [Streptomyces sp. NA02950]|uniref:hypothetical protein n=1 Tax=Streptomyces sp. NA02950 TaxID=2742137 RepID=UPI001590550D|nr:hypothetical protein [Streptomyces sp. NA02950]QKV96712.1 hypothetical protein HUT19_37610 [Streptomyces sp. NA02950]
MNFRKFQPWARDALVKALGAREVLSGVTRCISEQRALILQLVRTATTNRVTVVQYPVAGISEAYERLQQDDMLETDFVAYFIVASAEAIAQAEVDGTPYMRTLRPEGQSTRQAEILRAPYRVQTGGDRG